VRRSWLAFLLLLSCPAWARLTPFDAAPLAARTPVILIHGWNADESTWESFLAAAQKHPTALQRCKFYRFGYDWADSIGTSADHLRRELAELPELKGRGAVLVGHSMGGLVARTYVETNAPGWSGPAQIGAVITLATPHHGSPQANLHWLAGDSKYSLLAGLIPLGLVGLLDKIPITAASRTEGGRDLGWDNFDGTMAPSLWNGASRFLAQLNAHLDSHPLRDELLRRYTVNAGYVTPVTPLSVISLQKQLREGDAYGAGASLMGYAFRDEQGERIDRWLLNDGAVPLESALFLRPGARVYDSDGTKFSVRLDIIKNRMQPLVSLGRLGNGLDHSQMARDNQIIAPLLDQLAVEDFNLLACASGGRVSLWRPGDKQPRPIAEAPAESLPARALGPDCLLLNTPDRMLRLTPESRQTLTRDAFGEGGWISPGGRLAVTDDGTLVRLDGPGFRRLLPAVGPVEEVVWSPDESRLAFVSPDGSLCLTDASELDLRQATDDQGQPLLPGLRPIAFTNNGAWLLAAGGTGLVNAAYRGDGRGAVMVVDASLGGEGLMLDREGVARTRVKIPATGAESVRALYQMAPGQAGGALLAAQGWSPIYGPGDAWLAWVQPGGVAIRTGEQTKVVALPDGPVTWLVREPNGGLVAIVAAPDGAKVFAIDAGLGTRRAVAQAPAEAAAAPQVSPDGRYVALPLLNGALFVTRLDGTQRWTLPGERPVWLPQPAARRWLAGRTDLG